MLKERSHATYSYILSVDGTVCTLHNKWQYTQTAVFWDPISFSLYFKT
jgi:hypothetical protein